MPVDQAMKVVAGPIFQGHPSDEGAFDKGDVKRVIAILGERHGLFGFAFVGKETAEFNHAIGIDAQRAVTVAGGRVGIVWDAEDGKGIPARVGQCLKRTVRANAEM